MKLFPASTGEARFGVAVSQAVFKKASARNRFRRAVIHGFEKERALFPISDILFIALPPAALLNTAGIVREIQECARRIRMTF
mgnify:CR=1 FL=1